MLPVAFSKPVILIVASSPTVIESVVAFSVKFFLIGFGAGLTVIFTVVDEGL